MQGTIAPWRYSFFNLGMDVGTVSGESDTKHFFLYPFAHYAFFLPFTNESGWYAGAGAGFMMAAYTFPEGKVSRNIFTADVSTGYIFGFGLTISYSFRTDFKTGSNKIALGYSYRFK